MRKSQYDELRQFILENLLLKKVMLFPDLVNAAVTSFPQTSKEDIIWYLLMVKLDLEARKLIRIQIQSRPLRVQIVALRRRRISPVF